MAAKRKASTKKDLESKIAALEAKLNKLSAKIESKPEAPKPEAPKPEPPKPAETTPPPVTFQEALEDAYNNSTMTSFQEYKAKVTGYVPAPNRYFVRLHAPVGKVPTSNWNDQKAKVTGYTQPSNQYFATRQRLAYSPPGKTFGSFSGTNMSVEGIEIKAQAPKPAEVTQQAPPPQQNEGKSKQQLLEEYENNYMQRLEKEKIEQAKAYQEMLETEAKAKSSSNRGSLPKGFESTSEPAPEAAKSSKGTLPKGF